MISHFKDQYDFLSNFFPCEITFRGGKFLSSEAAYQSAKSDDPSQFTELTAGESKKLGRKVKNRPDWDEIKLGVMEEILKIKFRPGSDLAEKLLSTGDEELVEGNWWGDQWWGVCNGIGENNLGKLLMKIRSELNGISRDF